MKRGFGGLLGRALLVVLCLFSFAVSSAGAAVTLPYISGGGTTTTFRLTNTTDETIVMAYPGREDWGCGSTCAKLTIAPHATVVLPADPGQGNVTWELPEGIAAKSQIVTPHAVWSRIDPLICRDVTNFYDVAWGEHMNGGILLAADKITGVSVVDDAGQVTATESLAPGELKIVAAPNVSHFRVVPQLGGARVAAVLYLNDWYTGSILIINGQ